MSHVYLALVCVDGRHICCLAYPELKALIARRQKAKGEEEEQYVIPVTMPEGKAFRVYVNAPGQKKTMLGKPALIARSDFPNRLFA